MAVTEELELDLEPALRRLQDLDTALQDSVSNFSSSLEESIQSVSFRPVVEEAEEAAQAGGEALEQSLSGAVEAFSATPIESDLTEAGEAGGEAISGALETSTEAFNADPIETGLSAAGEAGAETISDSLVAAGEEGSQSISDALDSSLTSFDASSVSEEIESSVADADTEVTISSVDASIIPKDIESAAAEAEPQVEVTDVDASAVTEAIEEAASAAEPSASLGALGEQAGEGASQFSQLASSGLEAAGAMKIAEGASGLLTGGLAQTISKAAPAGAAIAGIGFGLKTLFDAGAEAAQVQERLNRLLGEAAPLVEKIDIAGLNTDISTLAIDLGASDEAFRNAIGNFVQFANAGDISQKQTVETSKALVALSANAVALRPSLGDAGAVAESLGNAFIRGGRALVPYGIELSKTEIAAHAVSLGLAETTEAVTNADRVVAGADLALKEYGNSIAVNVGEASESAAVKAKSLSTAVGELVETLGGPVTSALTPAIELLTTVAKGLANPIETIKSDLRGVPDDASVAKQGFSLVEGAVSSLGAVVSQSSGEIDEALEESQTAFDDFAATVAEGFPGIGDALSEFSSDTDISFKEFKSGLDTTRQESEGFMADLQTIIKAGGVQLAAELAALGPETAARAAEQIAQQTPAQIKALEEQAVALHDVNVRLAKESARVQSEAKALAILEDAGIPTEAALQVLRDQNNASLQQIGEMTPAEAKKYIDTLSQGITAGGPQVANAAVAVTEAAGLRTSNTGRVVFDTAARAAVGAFLAPVQGATGEAGAAGSSVGSAGGRGVGEGVRAEIRTVESASIEAAQALHAGTGEAAAAGRSVGQSFTSGLTSILYGSGMGAARAAASAVGAALKPAANAGQRASSPSKDAMEVASNFKSGLVIELKRTGEVIRAASDLTQAMIPAAPSLTLARFPAVPNLQAIGPDSGGSTRLGKSITINGFSVTLQTIYDPRDPMSKRKAGQEILEIIGGLGAEDD